MARRKKRRAARAKLKKGKPSLVWYLLPVFLGVIGGIIGYFALRNKDRKMAERILIWGIIFTVISLVFQSVWATFGSTDFFEVTRTTQTFP